MRRQRFENGAADETDRAILELLAADARVSMADLARRVGLSAPSVAERVRRLEEVGVIEGYSARLNPAALGLALTVWIRVRPMPGEIARVAELIAAQEEIVACDRITGDDCFLAKAHVASVAALEALIDRLTPYASTNTSIVQSSPVAARAPKI